MALRLAKLVIAGFLIALAGFCALGILATYEPPGWPLLRGVYACVGLVALAGSAWWIRRSLAELSATPSLDQTDAS